MPSDQNALLDESLIEAISKGTTDEVERLLGAGANADGRAIEMAESALHKAKAERAKLLQNYSGLLPRAALYFTTWERAVADGDYVKAAEKVIRLIKSAPLRRPSPADVLPLLGSPLADIRKQAIMDVAALLGSRAVEHILPLLNDTDEFVRVYAVRALGEIADGSSAVVAIQAARTQASSDVVVYFDDALAAIVARTTTPGLILPQSDSALAPSVTCAGCSTVYKLGDDAIAVSLDVGYSLAARAVILTHGNPVKHEDLVSTLNDVSPEKIHNARERARAIWETIQASLLRGEERNWRCGVCGAVNVYPRGFRSAL